MDLIAGAVFQNGPTPGAQKMMRAEYEAAMRANELGVYGVWRINGPNPLNQMSFSSNPHSQQQQNHVDLDFCSRIGPNSRCVCGHLFKNHQDCMLQLSKNRRLAPN